jgi:hypothetical protein
MYWDNPRGIFRATSEVTMAQPVGKIIRIRNKFPGPKYLWVNTVGEGLRKHIHLCFSCTKHLPGQPENCPVSQHHYDHCRENGVGIVLVRCPLFDNRNPVNDSENDRTTG